MDLVSSIPADDGGLDRSVVERLKRMQRIIANDAQLQVILPCWQLPHSMEKQQICGAISHFKFMLVKAIGHQYLTEDSLTH